MSPKEQQQELQTRPPDGDDHDNGQGGVNDKEPLSPAMTVRPSVMDNGDGNKTASEGPISTSMFWSANLYSHQRPQQQQQEQESSIHRGEDDDDNDPSPPSCFQRCCHAWWSFYGQYEFLILVVVVILLAKAYPPLGAEYLQPQITATWLCVIFIFILAGLGLKTEEFGRALLEWKFNLIVQAYSFGVDSSVVFGVSRALLAAGALSKPLADGMVVCASLSMTINMVLVLTKSAGGSEASAIFNAAAGNLIGVVLTPLLILGFLGLSGSVNIAEVFYKLALRVVLPLSIGQVMRRFIPATVRFYTQHKVAFKKAQQLALVFLVYTVFCRTFQQDNNIRGLDVIIVIVVEFACLTGLMTGAWFMLRILFPHKPQLRVMGLFGCTHKTVAMGVPLINALYDGSDASIGLITLPLLIWHTMQLIIGSFLAPKLAAWVEREEERVGISSKDDVVDNEGGEEKNSSTTRSPGASSLKDEEGRLSTTTSTIPLPADVESATLSTAEATSDDVEATTK